MATKLPFLLIFTFITVTTSFRIDSIDSRFFNVTDLEVKSDRIEFKVIMKLEAAKPEIISSPIMEIPDEGVNQFKIVCNFWNHASYRRDHRKYTPEDIDENLCTHIVYNAADLDTTTFTISVGDPLVDIFEEYYRRVTDLKKKGIAVLISIGDYDEPIDNKYFQLAQNATARAYFVASVVEFIKAHNFDGLELHWAYPTCWRTNCINDGDHKEKQHLTNLVQELSDAFKPHGFLLSMLVSPLLNVILIAYDVPELSKYVDWFSVKSYGYHGHWEDQTQHHSSLSESEISMAYWIQCGAPKHKVLMGLSTRGASFALKDADENGFGAQANVGGGEPGEYTQQKGYLAFYEILEELKHFYYSVKYDDDIGRYAHFYEKWISYEDVEDIQRKADYIRRMNFGGAMISAIDEDEFLENSQYLCGKYPLLTAVNKVLRNVDDTSIDLHNCI